MCKQSGKAQRMNQIFEATEAEKEKAAGAGAAAGAAQTATSGAPAQPAGAQAAQAVVVKGSAGANYAGRGSSSVRQSIRDEEDAQDIALKRKRRSAAAGIGL